MKKIILTSLLFSSLLVANSAKAEFYLGADLVGSSANFDMRHDPNSTAGYSLSHDKKSSQTSIGGGVNFGYKFRSENIFFAPEYAYEYLNNKVYIPEYSSSQGTELQLEGRHIFKLNVGTKVNEKFDIFAFGGVSSATVELTNTGLLGDTSAGSQASAIMGLGTYLHLNKDWDIKLAYDYQRIKVKPSSKQDFLGTYEIPATTIDLHTVKVGLVYNF